MLDEWVRSVLDSERALAKHDSYPSFEVLGDLIFTLPINTNVVDMRIAVIV
ncbi:MAG: hypothetical protein GF344_10740 [Chitinivibrionales bacterium]|nr:hypothetical protein [Chitinivibrionales bacterium]MBD3357286.1 hypothetical protein [Chitinivibrionales bacterium]